MSQLTIVTTPENSGDGTPLATAFDYCNSNFNELYSRTQVTPPTSLVGSIGDTAGMYAYSSSYFYYCFANYDGHSTIWAQVTQVADVAIAAITDGNSNVTIQGAGGPAVVNINGTSNVAVFTTTGVSVTGNISVGGNITGSNVYGSNVSGDVITGNTVSSTGNIYAQDISISGFLTTNTGLSAASTYPAQLFSDGIVVDYINGAGRISVGAADSITFYNGGVANTAIVSFDPSGDINAQGGFSAVGNVVTQGIVSATGNIVTNGYFVGTFIGNVTGNFVVPGSNTQVIFNSNGNADAAGGFTYNKGSNTLTVLGIVSSQGNVIGGNITTTGKVSATGNITGGNILSTVNISSAGNIFGGNVLITNNAVVTGNLSVNNVTSFGVISATGNTSGGNLTTNGQVSATGNINTSAYLFVTKDIDVSGNLISSNISTGNSNVSGNAFGGNILTGGIVSATGNIYTQNYLLGNIAFTTGLPSASAIQSGNSNVLIGSVDGNVSVNVNNVSPLSLFTPVGQIVYGTLQVTGTITGGNLTTSGITSSIGDITTSGNVGAYANITGGNVLSTGIISSTGNATHGNILTDGLISSTGNATHGNLSVGAGTITVGNIVAAGNVVGNIGSLSNQFNTVFARATSAQYADLAEIYAADSDYEPGTVVVFGGTAEITVTTQYADVRVAGAISTDPAYLMNSTMDGLPVALRGRIPVKVIGTVNKGDLLVTAGGNPGYAISIGQSKDYPLAVFAKSIETNTDEGVKVITAVII